MKKLLTTAGSFILVLSMAAGPAYADKYKYYGYPGNSYYGHHHWHNQNRWAVWREPRVYNQVYVYEPPVVTTQTYYNQPVYSSIRCTNQVNPLGLLLGGAAGGVVGHQFGKGKGKVASTIAGAVLGSAVGTSVSQRCTEEVFRTAPLGTPIVWQRPGYDDNYYVTATREFETEGRYCREYQAVATIGGRNQQTYGTACMQPDGSWEIID